MVDKLEDKLKKVHIILLILGMFVFQYASPFINELIKKNNIESTIVSHEERLDALERGYIGNRELLMEIRFNLRKHIESSGQDYIESVPDNVIADSKKVK